MVRHGADNACQLECSPCRVLTLLDGPAQPELGQLLQRLGRAALALEAGQVSGVLTEVCIVRNTQCSQVCGKSMAHQNTACTRGDACQARLGAAVEHPMLIDVPRSRL